MTASRARSMRVVTRPRSALPYVDRDVVEWLSLLTACKGRLGDHCEASLSEICFELHSEVYLVVTALHPTSRTDHRVGAS